MTVLVKPGTASIDSGGAVIRYYAASMAGYSQETIDLIGPVIKRLEDQGKLDAQTLARECNEPGHPCQRLFEQNGAAALYRYHVMEAQRYISNVRWITVPVKGAPVRPPTRIITVPTDQEHSERSLPALARQGNGGLRKMALEDGLEDANVRAWKRREAARLLGAWLRYQSEWVEGDPLFGPVVEAVKTFQEKFEAEESARKALAAQAG